MGVIIFRHLSKLAFCAVQPTISGAQIDRLVHGLHVKLPSLILLAKVTPAVLSKKLTKTSNFLVALGFAFGMNQAFAEGAGPPGVSRLSLSDSTDDRKSNSVADGNYVGALPTSVQWYYEKNHSIIAIGSQTLQLTSDELSSADYSIHLDSRRLNYFNFTYMSPLFRWDSISQQNAWHSFLVAMSFNFGIGSADTSVRASSFTTTQSSAISSFFSSMLGFGLQLEWSYLNYIQPYVGYRILGIWYRHASSLSGAEFQGDSWGGSPTFGLITRFGDSRIAAFAEASQVSFFKKSARIAPSSEINLGVGLGTSF